ncbi:MAG: hypothetical protein ACR2LR_05375 [Hassallia sp.]
MHREVLGVVSDADDNAFGTAHKNNHRTESGYCQAVVRQVG